MSAHIVKAYDSELNQLRGYIVRMGEIVKGQLAEAINAIHNRDDDRARHAFAADGEVDALEYALNELAFKILALRQPMAGDLRLIIGSMRIARDMERIGDYAASLAKRTRKLNMAPELPVTNTVIRLGNLVIPVLHDAVEAFAREDAARAADINAMDDPIDDLYMVLVQEAIDYMQRHSDSVALCSQLLFMAKNLERIGDRATNIAETVQFIVAGDIPPKTRRSKTMPPLA
jgi:phosphate transport system protein